MERDCFDFASDDIYADNISVVDFSEDENSFQIAPRRFPGRAVATNILLMLVGFGAIGGTVFFSGNDQFAILVGVVTMVTVAGYAAIVLGRIRYEQKRGAWLVYDKQLQTIVLPRENKQFGLSQVIALQYISSCPFERPDLGIRSQLRLVTHGKTGREIWPLTASAYYSGAFENMLDRIVNTTPIPVVRTVRSRVTGSVTSQSYSPGTQFAPDRLLLVTLAVLALSLVAGFVGRHGLIDWIISLAAGFAIVGGISLLSARKWIAVDAQTKAQRNVIVAFSGLMFVIAAAAYLFVFFRE